MSENKSYFCRTCEEKDSSKFYEKRYNICKACYSKKMNIHKERTKEEITELKGRVETLETRVTELEEKIQKMKK